MCVHAVEWHLVSQGVGVTANEPLPEVARRPPAGGQVVRTAHLDVVNVQHTVIALVLVPPIRQPIGVLINVKAVNE